MNLLRLKRKNKKKIGIKRFLLVICSMIMSSFAWFAFSKVLNTTFSGHMVSWDIIFKKDGGVITNTESIDFSFSNLYPGVTDKITVDVENNGESTAELVYVIKSITFLGKTYSIKNPGSAKDNNSIVLETAYSSGSNVTQTILNTNTKINNEYLLENATENIIEEENYIRTPFTIRANKTEKLEKGDKGKFEISIEWPATDAQLTNKDDIDSAWGYSFSKYLQYCNENNIDLQSAISINMEIDAVQYVE